jgi:hypothetical protein
MIARLILTLARGSRSTRYVALAALALLVLLIVTSKLAPPAGHPADRRPDHSARGLRGPLGPQRSSQLAADELADARRTAARFFAGYLPFLYGRGSQRSIVGVTPALRSRLRGVQALLTPAERHRHPRVVSLTVLGRAPATALASALVADDGVADFTLRITLHQGAGGWRVSAIAGG